MNSKTKARLTLFLAVMSILFALFAALSFVSARKSADASNGIGGWTAVPAAQNWKIRDWATTINTEYDYDTGYTKFTGLNQFGETAYSPAMNSNGLTIDFYVNTADIKAGQSIGIYLSENQISAASEQSHFIANFWYRYGATPNSNGDIILDFANRHCAPYDGAAETRVAYSDYAHTNPVISNIDGFSVKRYQFYDGTEKIGFSLNFVKYDDSTYKLIFTMLYGAMRGTAKTVLFVPASYVPDTCYVGIYGNNTEGNVCYLKVSDSNTSASKVQISGDTLYNFISKETSYAYYNQKVELNGLSLRVTVPNISTDTSYEGDFWGIALASSPTNYFADRPVSFNAVIRPKGYNAKWTWLKYAYDHDLEHGIAYADVNKEHKAGRDYSGAYTLSLQSSISFILTFEELPANDMWKITLNLTEGTYDGSQDPVAYVPSEYFTSVLDGEGKCYVVSYAERANGSVPTLSMTCSIESGSAKNTLSFSVPGGTDFTVEAVHNALYTLPVCDQKIASSFDYANNGKIFAGYYIDGNYYNAGESITVENDLDIYVVYVDFALKNGAAIRKSGDMNTSGIRFMASLKNDVVYSTLAGGTISSFGIMIMPTDLIESGKDFTYENYGSSVERIFVSVGEISFDEDNAFDFYASIVKVYGNNYSRAFSARTFVIAKSGKIYYGEYDAANNSRTVYNVAVSAIKAGETGDVLCRYVHSVLNVNYDGTNFTLVTPLGSSDTVESLGSCTLSGSVLTLKVNVKSAFISDYGSAFSGLIYNGNRINIADAEQSLEGNVLTLIVNV